MSWSRKSRHERGYGTAWGKLRALVLERDSNLCVCKHCAAEDRTTLATEVHHIIPKAKGGTDALDNLMSVSKACHLRLDAEAQGKTIKPKVRIGLDGYPINE